MKMASRVYSCCLFGFVVGVFFSQCGVLFFHNWLGSRNYNLFVGLSIICIVGCCLTYRKSRHGQLALLERGRKNGSITPEEYAAKRQEILKDL
jgi:hypothetical protein